MLCLHHSLELIFFWSVITDSSCLKGEYLVSIMLLLFYVFCPTIYFYFLLQFVSSLQISFFFILAWSSFCYLHFTCIFFMRTQCCCMFFCCWRLLCGSALDRLADELPTVKEVTLATRILWRDLFPSTICLYY